MNKNVKRNMMKTIEILKDVHSNLPKYQSLDTMSLAHVIEWTQKNID